MNREEVIKIYFDMDGVLADFAGGVRKLLNIPPVDQEHHTPEQNDEMYGLMKKCPHFYERLELLEGAADLFHEVYAEYGDRCEILSGIPKPYRQIDTAAEDKLVWIRKMLSEEVKVNTVLRREKTEFVHGPGYILIDDFTKNIREWEQHGGTGILHENPEKTRRILCEMGLLL